MKKTILLILLTLTLAARAQIYTIDTTTLTTNVTTSSAWISITNVCTNIVYTTLNSNSVTTGEPLFTAFNKVNLNFSYVEGQIAGISTNGGTIYPSNTWSLTTITSAMANTSYWIGNSNGAALVSVSLSNGIATVKQLAP
jgi:hypothetical protein